MRALHRRGAFGIAVGTVILMMWLILLASLRKGQSVTPPPQMTIVGVTNHPTHGRSIALVMAFAYPASVGLAPAQSNTGSGWPPGSGKYAPPGISMTYVPTGGKTNFIVPIPPGEGQWRIPVIYARKRSYIAWQLDFGWLQPINFLVPAFYEEQYRPFVVYTPELPP